MSKTCKYLAFLCFQYIFLCFWDSAHVISDYVKSAKPTDIYIKKLCQPLLEYIDF